MAKATKLREKEAMENAFEKADSNASIAALGKAIAAIGEETAEVEAEEENSQGACKDLIANAREKNAQWFNCGKEDWI